MHNNGHHHCTGVIKNKRECGCGSVNSSNDQVLVLSCQTFLLALCDIFPDPHDVTFPWVLRRPKILAFKWLREPRAWVFHKFGRQVYRPKGEILSEQSVKTNLRVLEVRNKWPSPHKYPCKVSQRSKSRSNIQFSGVNSFFVIMGYLFSTLCDYFSARKTDILLIKTDSSEASKCKFRAWCCHIYLGNNCLVHYITLKIISSE